MANRDSKRELGTLENWLWEADCVIRGPIDAPKFKDYILPLVFLKQLSDVFDNELKQLGSTVKYADTDYSLVRFYIPGEARWINVARQTTNLGEYLTDAVRAVARENSKLSGVIDVKNISGNFPWGDNHRVQSSQDMPGYVNATKHGDAIYLNPVVRDKNA